MKQARSTWENENLRFTVWFRNLSVRKRIVSASLLLVITLTASMPIFLIVQNSFLNHFSHIVEVNSTSNSMLLKAHVRINQSRLNLFRYLQDYLPSTWEALAEVKEAEKLISAAQDKSEFDPETAKVMESIYPLFKSFESLIFEAQEAALDGDQSEVTRFVFQASKVGADLGHRIDLIVKGSEQHTARVNEEMKRDAENRLFLLFICYAAAIVITIVFAMYVARSITGPIADLRKGAELFQQGDFSEKLEVSGKDELSMLSQTFNDMAERLQIYFTELKVHQDHLEEIVDDRTKELIGTNYQLNQEIDERKNIERALQVAKDDAEVANRMKSEFLANMSHEIRTPMNGVVGMVSMLMQTELTIDQYDYARTIRSSADSLLTVINDILDFSKIETGKLEFEYLDFDLRIILDGIVGLLAGAAQQKNLALDCAISQGVNPFLIGDPGRLRQVLVNLLTNAIKFTPEGEVKIEVSQKEVVDHKVMLEFVVRDTGIGIPEEKQDKLFKTFSQVDASTTRKYGGTGLGLAISKKLAEMMGGDICFDSSEGKGATFVFTAEFLEQQVEPDVAWAPAPVELENNNDKQPKQGFQKWDCSVLLVEDNETNQKVGEHVLSSLGCHVDVAFDGVEAVKAFGRNVYDLIFMDIQMPVLDGIEATKRIRDIEGSTGYTRNRVPIIACTANAMKGDREKYLASDMDDYLDKPIDIDKFAAVLDLWCKELKIGDRAIVQEEVAETTAVEIDESQQAVSEENPVFDIDGALKRALGDKGFLKSLVQVFLDEQEKVLEEFSEYKQGGDSEGVRRKGHTIKGAAMNVGAQQISEQSYVIEQMGREGSWDTFDDQVELLKRKFAEFRKHIDGIDWESV